MIFAYLIISYVWTVISDFIVIVAWVQLWNMIEIFTLENENLKIERLNKLQLYDAKVTFVFDK